MKTKWWTRHPSELDAIHPLAQTSPRSRCALSRRAIAWSGRVSARAPTIDVVPKSQVQFRQSPIVKLFCVFADSSGGWSASSPAVSRKTLFLRRTETRSNSRSSTGRMHGARCPVRCTKHERGRTDPERKAEGKIKTESHAWRKWAIGQMKMWSHRDMLWSYAADNRVKGNMKPWSHA